MVSTPSFVGIDRALTQCYKSQSCGIVTRLQHEGFVLRPRAPTVVALVVGLGALPILAPSALAEPVLPTTQPSSIVLTATEPQQAVQLKSQQIAFASATLRVQATRGDPAAMTYLAAIPRPDPSPTHSRPRPALNPTTNANGPRVRWPLGRPEVVFVVFDFLRSLSPSPLPARGEGQDEGKMVGRERLVFAQKFLATKPDAWIEGRDPVPGNYSYSASNMSGGLQK